MKTPMLALLVFIIGASWAATTTPTSLPTCIGGPFRGPSVPTTPPTPDTVPSCLAIPTETTSVLGYGPLPQPGMARTQSIGYHHAGSQTINASYTTLTGLLQVNNPDISQSGANAHVLQSYLFTPDFSRYLQVGWIEEEWHGDVRRVFVENNLPGYAGRSYFEQYPLVDGQQYTFAVVTKPGGWNTMIWWNGSWQGLLFIPDVTPREGVEQQFLEIYTSNGVHPFVEPLYNDRSDLVYQETLVRWDTLIATSTTQDSPYEANWISPYYQWQPGCWGAC